MLVSLRPDQKKVATIVAAVLAVLIFAIVVLPLMQQPAEDSASRIVEELTPPNKSVEIPERIVERRIIVPGPINVSDEVDYFTEQQVLKLLNNRDPDNEAHRYTKGDMRTATGAEFDEFFTALKNSQQETGVAKVYDAAQTVFWKHPEESRHQIGVGYMITRDEMGYDHCYALVLVMTWDKVAIAAVNTANPESGRFIWTSENTPGSKGAYIITLTSG